MSLPQRKAVRLKEYDYSSSGAYFITICTKNKHEMLWKNVGARIACPHKSGAANQSEPHVGARIARPQKGEAAAQGEPHVGARIARPHNVRCLSEYGVVIDRAIHQISEHYPCVTVDKYVIMPNHIHMILILLNDGGRAMRAPTVSTIINQMKGHITKEVGFSLWQKLFHDRIIRNEQEYIKIWKYIDTNPIKWVEDCFYVK